MLRFDGKLSSKVHEASLTQVSEKMRQLLIIMAKKKSCTKNRSCALFCLQLTAAENTFSVAEYKLGSADLADSAASNSFSAIIQE